MSLFWPQWKYKTVPGAKHSHYPLLHCDCNSFFLLKYVFHWHWNASEASEWVQPDWGSRCGHPATSCAYLLTGCESKGSLYRPQCSLKAAPPPSSTLFLFIDRWTKHRKREDKERHVLRIEFFDVVVVVFLMKFLLSRWRLWFFKWVLTIID